MKVLKGFGKRSDSTGAGSAIADTKQDRVSEANRALRTAAAGGSAGAKPTALPREGCGPQDSVARALGTSRVVRGYEIKREPIGRMLQAMKVLEEMPAGLMQACFPGKDADAALASLKGLTTDALLSLLVSAGAAAPAFVVRAFSAISGVPEDALLSDPNVGLDGLMEMAEAWFELNGIGNFLKAAGPMMRGLRAAMRTGSSG